MLWLKITLRWDLCSSSLKNLNHTHTDKVIDLEVGLKSKCQFQLENNFSELKLAFVSRRWLAIVCLPKQPCSCRTFYSENSGAVLWKNTFLWGHCFLCLGFGGQHLRQTKISARHTTVCPRPSEYYFARITFSKHKSLPQSHGPSFQWGKGQCTYFGFNHSESLSQSRHSWCFAEVHDQNTFLCPHMQILGNDFLPSAGCKATFEHATSSRCRQGQYHPCFCSRHRYTILSFCCHVSTCRCACVGCLQTVWWLEHRSRLESDSYLHLTSLQSPASSGGDGSQWHLIVCTTGRPEVFIWNF